MGGRTGPAMYITPFATNGNENGGQPASASVHPFMSVTARRSVDTYEDKVVSEYEED